MPVAVLPRHVLVSVLKDQDGRLVHLDRVLLALETRLTRRAAVEVSITVDCNGHRIGTLAF